MTYSSLEQRMITAYLEMFPDFIPDEQAGVSVAAQREFYDLMKGLLQLLSSEPSLIVPTLHEDDAFPSLFKKSYGKPDLQVNMSKCTKAVQDLLTNMYLIGQGADVKVSKRHLNVLSALGVKDLAKLPTAWTWMSTKPEASQVAFAYCLFNKTHVYSADVYARLLGEKVYRRLEEWMLAQGYMPYDVYDIIASDCKLSLTYANPAWGGDRPSGGREYKIKHTGISAQYDAFARSPASFGLCIPYGLKQFLENFDSMNVVVKDFVIERTKKCDGCRYCVQTDKSGTRSLAYIKVTHEQTERALCPYFPGYAYSWRRIDDSLVDKLIQMLTFMDKFAPKNKQGVMNHAELN